MRNTMSKVAKKVNGIRIGAENKLALWMNGCAGLKDDNAGMGTIEMVLLIVVLISLVVLFRGGIKAVLSSVMNTISSGAEQITIE